MAIAEPPHLRLVQASTAVPPVPPSRGPRVSTRGGRYQRWHTETRTEPEEEGWLLTYLDVITLILVMMVVMLSLAGPPGNTTDTTGESTSNSPAANASAVPASAQPDIVPPVPLPVPRPPTEGTATVPQDPLAIAIAALGSDIQVERSDKGVRFRISSELLFEPGAAHLAGAGLAALDSLVPVLMAQPELRLVIEGHTDSTPIRTERYPSNWELSTGRAGAVARHLIDRGVAPQRLQASGFADTRPLASPANPVDRAFNRRVELIMETPATTPLR